MNLNTCSIFSSKIQTFFSKDFVYSCKPFHSLSQQDNLRLNEQHHLGFFQTFLKSFLKLDNLPFYLDKEGFFDLNIYRFNSIAPNSNSADAIASLSPNGEDLICVKEKKQSLLFFPKFFATQKTFLNANIMFNKLKMLQSDSK